MSYLLGMIGMCNLLDAIYSITLYLNAPSYEGSKKQTWRRDHWVRCVRGLLAIMTMGIGYLLYLGGK